ncbi:hypothetical protein RF11_00361 [Thelohanellus kitauei]|uniref:Uncharacterized protein n=1 Tax=Thelohanellus kitauei TaxID=669202 RepID=A0A0C2JWH6_THEKT|nr:hypothetical protein RF11_00361 [Thelohanellus kitauei]
MNLFFAKYLRIVRLLADLFPRTPCSMYSVQKLKVFSPFPGLCPHACVTARSSLLLLEILDVSFIILLPFRVRRRQNGLKVVASPWDVSVIIEYCREMFTFHDSRLLTVT